MNTKEFTSTIGANCANLPYIANIDIEGKSVTVTVTGKTRKEGAGKGTQTKYAGTLASEGLEPVTFDNCNSCQIGDKIIRYAGGKVFRAAGSRTTKVVRTFAAMNDETIEKNATEILEFIKAGWQVYVSRCTKYGIDTVAAPNFDTLLASYIERLKERREEERIDDAKAAKAAKLAAINAEINAAAAAQDFGRVMELGQKAKELQDLPLEAFLSTETETESESESETETESESEKE